MNKLLLLLFVILSSLYISDAAIINITMFNDGTSNFNITQNTTKEITIGKGVTITNANISIKGYLGTNYSCEQLVPFNATSCGGVIGGVYAQTYDPLRVWNVAGWNDSDYNTGLGISGLGLTNNQFYVNYTKPTNYNPFTTLLEIKTSGGIQNVTLLPSCFNWDNLAIEFDIGRIGSDNSMNVFCLNASNSIFITQINLDDGLSVPLFYEKKLYWGLYPKNLTNVSIYMNSTRVFNYTGVYNSTNLTIPLNISAINTYLVTNGTIPITFITDTYGVLNVFNLSIQYLDFFKCNGTGQQIYNVTLYDEDNITLLRGDISVDLSSIDNVLNYQDVNVNSIAICSITNNTYYVTGTVSSNKGYLTKLYLNDLPLNNNVTYNSIYNYPVADKSSLQYSLKDYAYYNYPNVIGLMQRYYPLNHTWLTVQQDKSDQFGQLLYHIRELDTEYRFLFCQKTEFLSPNYICTGTNLLDSTSTLKFSCTSSLCVVTSQIIPNTTSSQNISVYYNYNQNTGIITVNWNDPTVTTNAVNVQVVQEQNVIPNVICSVNSHSSSGSMSCNTTGYYGYVNLIVVSNSTIDTNIISENLHIDLNNTDKIHKHIPVNESSFWTVVIFMVFVGLGLMAGGLTAPLILGGASLIIMFWLGISSALTVPMLGAMLIVIGVVSWVVRT